jgi:hypothetical protein
MSYEAFPPSLRKVMSIGMGFRLRAGRPGYNHFTIRGKKYQNCGILTSTPKNEVVRSLVGTLGTLVHFRTYVMAHMHQPARNLVYLHEIVQCNLNPEHNANKPSNFP